MVPLKELTAETVLSDDVLTEVFDQEDELYKSRLSCRWRTGPESWG